MSRRHEDKGKLTPFIPIMKEIWECKAWREMSAGARLLYIALRGRYNFKAPNNGHRAASGHAAVTPRSVVNWRRGIIRLSRRRGRRRSPECRARVPLRS